MSDPEKDWTAEFQARVDAGGGCICRVRCTCRQNAITTSGSAAPPGSRRAEDGQLVVKGEHAAEWAAWLRGMAGDLEDVLAEVEPITEDSGSL
jgi:hypothetical protein